MSPTRKSFSLKLKEEEIDIDGVPYRLRELTGAQRDAYIKTQSDRAERNVEGKVIGVKNFDGIHTKLLSMSLVDASGKLVKEEVLRSWPSSVCEALYTAAQELSGLDKAEEKGAAEEAAKND